MMKRSTRSIDVPKLRRNMKNRSRIAETMCCGYLSGFAYVKLVVLWLVCIALDLLIGFRFELLYPVWLLIRNCYDSFRFQGLVSSLQYSAFSAFFVCATATTDLICFVLLPVQLLLFLASTYVWVQFVWHTGGVLSSWLGLRDSSSCGAVSTPELGLASVGGTLTPGRECVSSSSSSSSPSSASSTSRSFSSSSSSSMLGGFGVALTAAFAHSSSLTSDLCRPFAAHCIGYPVVTLGFGLKTYMSLWRFKRRQREVSRENEVYGRLLAEALPSVYEGPKVYSRCNGAAIQEQDSTIDYETELLPSLAICASPSSTTSGLGASQRKSSRTSSSWKQNGCKQLNTKRIPSHANGSLLTSRKDTTNQNINDDDDTASSASACGTSRMSLWRLIWDVIWMVLSVLTGSSGDTMSSSLDDRISLSSNEIDSDEEMMEQEETSFQPDDLPLPSTRLLPQQRNTNVKKSKGSCTRLKAGRSRARNMHNQSEYVLSANNAAAQPLVSLSTNSSCLTTNNLLNLNSGTAAAQDNTLSSSSSSSPPNNAYTSTGNTSVTNTIFVASSQPSIASIPNKANDDYVTVEELETLKGELRAARSQETDLRCMLQQAVNAEKQTKGELTQLKMKQEQTENKLSNLLKAREQDKCSIQLLEKRLIEAHAKKNELEKELNAERRSKLKEEHAAARALAAAQSIKSVDCGEACKARKADLEREIRATRRDLKAKEELTSVYEEQLRQLREFKESNEIQDLQSTLAALRDKNHQLEQSLSAENRLKQDLFRVLTETRSQTEMLRQQIRAKDVELVELRQRLSSESNDACKMCPSGNSRGAVQSLNSSNAVRCGNGPSAASSLLSPVVNGVGGTLKMSSSSVNSEQNMELLTAALSNAASSAYLPYPFGGQNSANEHLLFDATVSSGGPGVNAPSSATTAAAASGDSLRFSNTTTKFGVPSATSSTSTSVRST
ncbi:unnamed protein product [Anisakis simplex]|uniref:Macoilin (inferred by orthology to a human protein) n=1 Tax=Anisakis simplex TaxID=6269 RepID=A0A0M3JYN7_ANISI|nr:unnamed protein product [Anisakis simplex]